MTAVRPATSPPASTPSVVQSSGASSRTDAITMAVSTWLLLGLFADGWAHNTLDSLETFFTPWHALFYSGFAATAAWIGWVVIRRQQIGMPGRQAIPAGYGLAVLGVGVFGVGGLGDLTWHTVFGIEQGIEALFSPTHLVLFVGITLILSTPLRAAWQVDEQSSPHWRQFGPVLASVTLLTANTMFMLMFLSPFTIDVAPEWLGQVEQGVDQLFIVAVAAAVLVFNAVLLIPTLRMARRWVLPRGAVALLWATVAVLGGALQGYDQWQTTVAIVVAGIAADQFVRRMQGNHPLTRRSVWVVGVTVPAVLWSVVYAVHGLTSGIGLSAELWTGNIIWAALTGGLLAVVMEPPRRRAIPMPDVSVGHSGVPSVG